MSEEWEEKFHSGKQRKYWKNKSTGKTTWVEPFVKLPSGEVERPSATGTSKSSSSEGEWEEKFSVQHKRKYWKNKSTGKTTWKEPSTHAGSTEPALSPSVKKTASTLKQEKEGQGGSEVAEGGDEWEEKFHTGKQRKYWKNKRTGKATWTEPPKAPIDNSKLVVSSDPAQKSTSPWGEDWTEHFSAAKNRKFWKNRKTGKAQWEEPPRVNDQGADAANWEPLLNSEQYNVLKKDHSELSKLYDEVKIENSQLQATLQQTKNELEERMKPSKSNEQDTDELRKRLQDNETQIERLSALCELYKKSHDDAETRFQEATAKETFSATDIAALQEQHEASVRKLNAELELTVLQEKTKGESSIYDVTRQLNEAKLQNETLSIKCNLLKEERDEIANKLAESTTNEQIRLKSSNENESKIVELEQRIVELQNTIEDLEKQNSNSSFLLEELKKTSVEMNNRVTEEKVKLEMVLEEKTNSLNALEDRCEELAASNSKLVIERDLLKELNEEADNRKSARENSEAMSVDEIKQDFDSKVKKLNAEFEIKLLEEKVTGDKSVLEAQRELNELKTLYEHLNARYNNISEEKKMFVAEVNHLKQQCRDLRQEKDKLVEALHFARVSNQKLPEHQSNDQNQHAEENGRIEEYESEMESMNEKCESLEARLRDTTSQFSQCRETLQNVEAEKSKLLAELEAKEGSDHNLLEERDMYKRKYEEAEERFRAWEKKRDGNDSLSSQNIQELQMLHESQCRKQAIEFEIQLLEERSKGEQRLFEANSEINSLKAKYHQLEAESNIKCDTLRAEKEIAENALIRHNQKPTGYSSIPNASTAQSANALKSRLFSVIRSFDATHSTPPDSPPPLDGIDVCYDEDDTPLNSPPSSDDDS